MGMYTEFYFTAELKPETPADVIRTLDGMVKGHSIVRPDHPLFKTNRQDCMLVGGSAYSLYDRPTFRRGCYSQEWELHVHSSFKNYDGEIKHFLDWIEPHVADVHQFLGYYRYEQDTAPTLIYISDAGKIVTQPIGAPEGLDGQAVEHIAKAGAARRD